jgi:hypothetical protein
MVLLTASIAACDRTMGFSRSLRNGEIGDPAEYVGVSCQRSRQQRM